MTPQSDERQPGAAGEAETDEPLAAWLREKITAEGPITFAEFMGHALYHPQFGYYTTGPNIGPKGDFVTSPEASPAFGRLLATHLADVDAMLGNPDSFTAIEFGPGKGTLALDLLDEMEGAYPDLYARLTYRLVDVSPALQEVQRERLLPRHAAHVSWHTNLSDVPAALEGAVIANEVADAFPVHVLENKDGALLEHYVGLDAEGKLAMVLRAPSDPGLAGFMNESSLTLEPGERIEVNLAAKDWLASMGRVVSWGVITIIDYGDEAPARYSAVRREGTLLGYYGGAVTDDVLAHPGKQDLTALVDFTALRRSAERAGFEVLAVLRQANFLLGLGLGTTHTAESVVAPGDVEGALSYRRGLQSLISMEGLGRFHVLVLAKGVDAAQAQSALSGLKYAQY